MRRRLLLSLGLAGMIAGLSLLATYATASPPDVANHATMSVMIDTSTVVDLSPDIGAVAAPTSALAFMSTPTAYATDIGARAPAEMNGDNRYLYSDSEVMARMPSRAASRTEPSTDCDQSYVSSIARPTSRPLRL